MTHTHIGVKDSGSSSWTCGLPPSSCLILCVYSCSLVQSCVWRRTWCDRSLGAGGPEWTEVFGVRLWEFSSSFRNQCSEPMCSLILNDVVFSGVTRGHIIDVHCPDDHHRWITLTDPHGPTMGKQTARAKSIWTEWKWKWGEWPLEGEGWGVGEERVWNQLLFQRRTHFLQWEKNDQCRGEDVSSEGVKNRPVSRIDFKNQ